MKVREDSMEVQGESVPTGYGNISLATVFSCTSIFFSCIFFESYISRSFGKDLDALRKVGKVTKLQDSQFFC